MSDDGTYHAIGGSTYNSEAVDVVLVQVLSYDAKSGNWSSSHDPLDYDDEYTLSSLSVSSDGQSLAVGINAHGNDHSDQGIMFVMRDDGKLDGNKGFSGLGLVEGRGHNDLLGSRVVISGDGTLAAASSRKGYVSFFKTG